MNKMNCFLFLSAVKMLKNNSNKTRILARSENKNLECRYPEQGILKGEVPQYHTPPV